MENQLSQRLGLEWLGLRAIGGKGGALCSVDGVPKEICFSTDRVRGFIEKYGKVQPVMPDVSGLGAREAAERVLAALRINQEFFQHVKDVGDELERGIKAYDVSADPDNAANALWDAKPDIDFWLQKVVVKINPGPLGVMPPRPPTPPPPRPEGTQTSGFVRPAGPPPVPALVHPVIARGPRESDVVLAPDAGVDYLGDPSKGPLG